MAFVCHKIVDEKKMNTPSCYSFFKIRKALGFLFIVCCLIAAPAIAVEDKLSFGMFPAVPPVMLEERYGPLTKAFENLLARKVVFRTKHTPEDFYKSLENGAYDIAVVQRFNYIQIEVLTSLYRPLLMRREKVRGVIVVAGDSDISQLQDLKNRTIAIPSSHSAASVFATYMFKQAGLSEDQYSFVDLNNHNSCLLAVVNKKVIACATTEKLFNIISKNRKLDLKITASSIELPGLFIVTHTRIDHLRDEFLQDLLKFSETSAGDEVLKKALLEDLVEIGLNDFVEADKIINELRK